MIQRILRSQTVLLIVWLVDANNSCVAIERLLYDNVLSCAVLVEFMIAAEKNYLPAILRLLFLSWEITCGPCVDIIHMLIVRAYCWHCLWFLTLLHTAYMSSSLPLTNYVHSIFMLFSNLLFLSWEITCGPCVDIKHMLIVYTCILLTLLVIS